jgi:phosphate-selective porin OprO and OprP
VSACHRSVCVAAATVLVALSAATARAQTPPANPVTAGWQDGFFIQSANGDFRLNFTLVAQADGRFVVSDDTDAVIDTFTVRKMRPGLNGRIARYFDFTVVPDFGNGVSVLQDAYLDLRFSNAFRVRAGKSKSPIGYEILIGDPFLLFPERSLASGLVPNRDVGVQALGDLAGGRVTYAAGLYNGIPDGTSSVLDLDAGDSKDLEGRVLVQPFRRAQNPGPLNGLGFALGGSHGAQRGGVLPLFRTSVGQRYFSYVTPAAPGGDRTRVTPAAFYYHNALGLFAEYMQSTQDVLNAGATTEVANHGWQVTGSYVLTGEAGADRGVRPRANFDPATHAYGALQVVARYSHVTIDDNAFAAGLAAAGSSREADSFIVGVNWYPAYFIKYYATFEHTKFEGGLVPERDPEDAVVFRAQVAF